MLSWATLLLSISLSVRARLRVSCYVCSHLRPSTVSSCFRSLRSLVFFFVSFSTSKTKMCDDVFSSFLYLSACSLGVSLDADFCGVVLCATLLVFEALLSHTRTLAASFRFSFSPSPPPPLPPFDLAFCFLLFPAFPRLYVFLCSVCVSVVCDAAAIPLTFLSPSLSLHRYGHTTRISL